MWLSVLTMNPQSTCCWKKLAREVVCSSPGSVLAGNAPAGSPRKSSSNGQGLDETIFKVSSTPRARESVRCLQEVTEGSPAPICCHFHVTPTEQRIPGKTGLWMDCSLHKIHSRNLPSDEKYS